MNTPTPFTTALNANTCGANAPVIPPAIASTSSTETTNPPAVDPPAITHDMPAKTSVPKRRGQPTRGKSFHVPHSHLQANGSAVAPAQHDAINTPVPLSIKSPGSPRADAIDDDVVVMDAPLGAPISSGNVLLSDAPLANASSMKSAPPQVVSPLSASPTQPLTSPESTPAPSTADIGERAACPVCGLVVVIARMNSHLDLCLAACERRDGLRKDSERKCVYGNMG